MARSKTGRFRRLIKAGLSKGLDALGREAVDAPIQGEARVTFEDAKGNELAALSVPTGQTILEVAKAAGLDLDHFCGGQCSCGTCRVKVCSGERALSTAAGNEQMVLGQASLAAGGRLACQARVAGDVRIQIPRWF